MKIVFAKDHQRNNKLFSHRMFGDWNQSRKMFLAIFCLVWDFVVVIVCFLVCLSGFLLLSAKVACCLESPGAVWQWFGVSVATRAGRQAWCFSSVHGLAEGEVGHSRSNSCLGLLRKTYHCTMIEVLDIWMQSLHRLVLTVMKPCPCCWIACIMCLLLYGVVRLQEAQQNKWVKQAPSVRLGIKQHFLSAKTV